MKFGFVAKHRGAWPVLMMCEALGVPRSAVLRVAEQAPKCKKPERRSAGQPCAPELPGQRPTCGAQGVWHDVLALGQRYGLHRIERLMRA